jgi:hypothetical protein
MTFNVIDMYNNVSYECQDIVYHSLSYHTCSDETIKSVYTFIAAIILYVNISDIEMTISEIGAVMVIWLVDLQLPVQSVLITT